MPVQNARHVPIAERAMPVSRDEWDALLGRLAAVEQELAEHRALLSKTEHVRFLPPVDDATLVQVLAVSTAGRAFTATELRDHARVDADLQRVLGSRSVKQIGKWLRRVMDREIGGFVLRRVGREHGGVLWLVVSAIHLQPPAGVDDRDGAD